MRTTTSRQSCEVLLKEGRLFLSPRHRHPKELPADIDAGPLGEEVLAALDNEQAASRSPRDHVWRILLELLGILSKGLKSRHRVKIRRTMEAGKLQEIRILGPDGDRTELFHESPELIGMCTRGLLELPASKSNKEQIMEHQFCGAFVFRGKLYVDREEKVGGPRRMVWPLKELPLTIDAESLGKEVLASLADYRIDGRPILADEWDVLNQELLDFFGEKSIGAFERKKKEVTVRRDVASGIITLFPERGEDVLDLESSEDPTRLGGSIRNHLALPDPDPTQG